MFGICAHVYGLNNGLCGVCEISFVLQPPILTFSATNRGVSVDEWSRSIYIYICNTNTSKTQTQSKILAYQNSKHPFTFTANSKPKLSRKHTHAYAYSNKQ